MIGGMDLAQVIAAIPHQRMVGITHLDHGENWTQLKLAWSPDLVGYPETGVLAGGAIFTLMDTAAGMSVIVRLGAWRPLATLDLRLDYLKPAAPGLDVVARAECYKLTRRVAFVRGTAYHDDPEHPIAHATGTFMLTGE